MSFGAQPRRRVHQGPAVHLIPRQVFLLTKKNGQHRAALSMCVRKKWTAARVANSLIVKEMVLSL
jgi:hypothetical protein